MELPYCNGINKRMREVLERWFEDESVFNNMKTIMNPNFYNGSFGCKMAAFVVYFMIKKHEKDIRNGDYSIVDELVANNLYFVGYRDFKVYGDLYKVFVVNEASELNQENLQWQLNILEATNTKPFLKPEHMKGNLLKGDYYKMFDLELVEYKQAQRIKRHWKNIKAIKATTANQVLILSKSYNGKILAKLNKTQQANLSVDRKVVYII